MNTRDEILSMEAGKEMDARIAEKVMKWHVNIVHDYEGWYDEENGFQRSTSNYAFDDCDEEANIYEWHPSNDLNTAWEVVEKMLTIYPTNDVSLKSTCRGWLCTIDVGGAEFTRNAETAPLAICRAALLAVMEAK